MPVKDLRKWQDSDSVVPLQCAKDLSKFSLNMHIKFDGHEEISSETQKVSLRECPQSITLLVSGCSIPTFLQKFWMVNYSINSFKSINGDHLALNPKQ